MSDESIIEISLAGQWRTVAKLTLDGDPQEGYAGTPTHLTYDLDYALDRIIATVRFCADDG